MISLTDAEHRYSSDATVSLPDIDLKQGEDLLILGSSGSGKSTLLHVLAGLLKPTRGLLKIDGVDLYSLSESKRDRYRGKNIGIIFQQLHLLDAVNVLENVMLAQYMAGLPGDPGKARLILEELDILDKEKAYINELSQGQKQRTGIARALVNSPKLLMADEPTSSLDDRRCSQVIGLLMEQAERHNATLIISTHDRRVKAHFSDTVDLDELNREVIYESL